MNGHRVQPGPERPRLRIEKDSDAVFEAAVRAGVLSEDPEAENFAGHYMYMHHDRDGAAWFKHRDTRAYVTLPPASAAHGKSATHGKSAAHGKCPADGNGAGQGGKTADDNGSEAGETVRADRTKRAGGPGPGLWSAVLLAGVFLAGALVNLDRGGPGVGTVRLNELTARFYAEAVSGDASPDRTAEAAREWGLRLEAALLEVAGRHGIALFPAEAVAAGAEDYTAEVRDAMRRAAPGAGAPG